MSRDAHLAVTVSTKFEVDTNDHLLPSYSVIAADMLRDLGAKKFQGEGVVPGEYFLVSTKLDTFCYKATTM